MADKESSGVYKTCLSISPLSFFYALTWEFILLKHVNNMLLYRDIYVTQKTIIMV